jgi:beta-lactamase class A
MLKHRAWWLLIVLCCAPTLAAGQAQREEAKPAPRLERLQARLRALADGFPGTLGVAVRDLRSGEEVSINGERLFPMASVYKIPIMVEVFRQIEAGKFTLDDRIEVGDDERTLGSGLLTILSSGLRPTIKDLITLMIVVSDNEATDILLKKVGAANVTATMRALGLNNLRVDRTTFELIRDFIALTDERLRGKTSMKEIAALGPRAAVSPERQAEAEREFAQVMKDVSSPSDLARLLEKIYKGEAASKESCQQMLRILGQQQFRQRLPRYLPESARLLHKTGTIGSTTNDAGIMLVRGAPVAIVVFTVDKRISRGEVEDYLGRVARTVYDFFDYLQP